MLIEKIKNLINLNKESSNKKKIENLVVFIIILIVTIIAINIIWNTEEKTRKSDKNSVNKQLATTNDDNYTEDNNNLEERLEKILKSIDGVGKVNVFVNYSETSTVVAMYNQNTKESSTQETDTSGGVRTIQETDTKKEVVYNEASGSKTPVTEKVINPKIEGAIITAEGASSTNTKANIISAVEAVTGLATHKIQVFEMNK